MYNEHIGDTRPPLHKPGDTHEYNGPQTDAENCSQDNGRSDLTSKLEHDLLNSEHLQTLLQGSGISPEVVRARGYRTIEKKADLRRLGFADSQCNPPGLLLPAYSPNGEIANYQFRPDQPRIKDGEPAKYENPFGSRATLDVHPFSQEKLADPSVPLFVTVGIKQGDALVSRGLCTVTLLGVWNWRGTNEHGGKTALAEWEFVALNARQVYIVFDSDVMLKPSVHAALARLKSFLEVR
jgi:hypothetical protein